MAERIEPNVDASVWTMTLREGVEFGNGDPFDAAAVKAATDRYLTDEASRARSVAQHIASVEVVDPLTVKYNLTAPYGYFPIYLAGGGGGGAMGFIPNVKLIEERGADAFGQDSTGGGAGPYEVKIWAPPERVVLEAKEDWWGGPVCVQELTFVALPGGQARLDALRLGELDMAVLYRDAVESEAGRAEFESVSAFHHSGNMIEFSQGDERLADIRVRRAIAASMDLDVINERAFGGLALAWSGLIHPDSKLMPGGTEGPAYDPELAQALVDELEAEGMDLTFEVLAADQPANVESALAAEALMEAVGFTIETVAVPQPQLIAALVEGDFQIAFGGQQGDETTMYLSLARFGSNPPNRYSFADPAFDEALIKLQAAEGDDELRVALEEIQAVWNETLPALAIFTDRQDWLWRDGVKGLQFTRGVHPLFDEIYVEE
jgi:peptide/nickel transport system substrate-binding protein